MEKKQLIQKLTQELKGIILENIHDMSQKELKIADLIHTTLNNYKNLNIIIPEERNFTLSIKNSFYFNLNQCYHYLFYPSNKAPDLMLRIVFENLIILKFLLENNINCCLDWYYWGYNISLNTYPDVPGLDKNIVETIWEDFSNWKKKTISAISKIYGKNKIDLILNNKYGWAYSKKIKRLTLSSIAKDCDATLAYECFKYHSDIVHSNTFELQLNISRLENHTFNISRSIINALSLISTYLFDYIVKDENYTKFSNSLDSASKYEEKYNNNYLKFLIENNKKNIDEYLANKD